MEGQDAIWSSVALDSNTAEKVLGFLRRKYWRVYGTKPDLPQGARCFISQNNGGITGLLCLEFSDGRPFSIEQLFRISKVSLLIQHRQQFIYLSRWAADQQTGKALLKAALIWAIQNGRKYVLACSKPKVLRYLQHTFKLPIKILPASLLVKKVPAAHAKFYLSQPQPILYVGCCQEWYDILVL